jgi:hypothetical protein
MYDNTEYDQGYSPQQYGGNKGIFSDFADSLKMLFNNFTK